MAKNHEFKFLTARAAAQVLALRPCTGYLGALPVEGRPLRYRNDRKSTVHQSNSHVKDKNDQDCHLEEWLSSADAKKLDLVCLKIIKLPQVREILKSATRLRVDESCRLSNGLSLTKPQMFRSLCLCDPKINGYPIQMRSKFFTLGPRGLRVGACEFLNLPNADSDDCFLELSPRPSVDGRPRFVLEYATTLISEESALPTYVLASQTDVTQAIQEVAATVMLERMQASTTRQAGSFRNKKSRHSGVAIDEDEGCTSDSMSNSPVDWMTALRTPRGTQRRKHRISPRTADALFSLLNQVAMQHARAFVLSQPRHSDSTSSEWQIVYTSPAVHRRPADLCVALSHTESATLLRLGTALRGETPVKMTVQWGEASEDMLLIAEPMMRDQKVSCWLCFLVDLDNASRGME